MQEEVEGIEWFNLRHIHFPVNCSGALLVMKSIMLAFLPRGDYLHLFLSSTSLLAFIVS